MKTRIAGLGTAALLLALLGGCASAPAAPPAHADKPAMRGAYRAVAEDFHARLAAAGRPAGRPPELLLDSSTGMMFYSSERSAVILPYWPEMGREARLIYEASAVPGVSAEQAYWTYLWFLVAHELAHQFMHAHGAPRSHYDSEFGANRLAIAYWMAAGQEARLAYLERLIEAALPQLAPANPTPPGVAEAGYFAEHYYQIAERPVGYAYYQLRMMQELLPQRRRFDFAQLVRDYAP